MSILHVIGDVLKWMLYIALIIIRVVFYLLTVFCVLGVIIIRAMVPSHRSPFG